MKKQLERFSLLATEPGEIPFSFTHMLASSLTYLGYAVGRESVTGASAFGFRIWVDTKANCPSATSIFDFNLLKTGVELNGYDCTYISRLWHEEAQESERREQAHRAIVDAIDQGIAPVVWDIGIPEWGVVTGYDDDAQAYDTLSIQNKRETMPYAQLGKREIPILSVTVPGNPSDATPAELARRTIQAAVDHARGREWEDRPNYENGLAAYPHWANLVRNVDQASFSSLYYIATYASLRRGAAIWLRGVAAGDATLTPAAAAYAQVAGELRAALYLVRLNPAFPTPELLDALHGNILRAYEAEQRGVELLEKWLK